MYKEKEMKVLLKQVGEILVPMPEYQTQHSAGVDLHAAILDPILLQPGERKLISSGLAMSIPNGYEGQIRPRSGLALKKGISIVNSPGTIDSDYSGPVGIILINHGSEPVEIQPLERIAQIVFTPVNQVKFDWVKELEQTERGSGGFGSTGEK